MRYVKYCLSILLFVGLFSIASAQGGPVGLLRRVFEKDRGIPKEEFQKRSDLLEKKYIGQYDLETKYIDEIQKKSGFLDNVDSLIKIVTSLREQLKIQREATRLKDLYIKNLENRIKELESKTGLEWETKDGYRYYPKK